MNLNDTQLERKEHFMYRLRGRTGVIRNPYYTNLAEGTVVQIRYWQKENDSIRVLYSRRNPKSTDFDSDTFVLLDEINFTDKEFSGYGIKLKGNRSERRDKFGDNFCIELQSNKRDIYLSTALISLLNLTKEENYVGFAHDPDTKTLYIFNSDSVNGYLLNKTNGRITSTADWRELESYYHTKVFKVIPEAIIDDNNPGFIFYSMSPDMSYYSEQEIIPVRGSKKTDKKKEVFTGKGFYETMTDDTTIKVNNTFTILQKK